MEITTKFKLKCYFKTARRCIGPDSILLFTLAYQAGRTSEIPLVTTMLSSVSAHLICSLLITGAESLLISHQSQYLTEPEASSPHSQEPSTGPYPESAESRSYHPTLFLHDTKIHPQFPGLVQPSGQKLTLSLLVSITLEVVLFRACAPFPALQQFVKCILEVVDRLCGLVVRVLDYRSRGPRFDSRALQKKSSGSETWSTQPREYN
jgi:hypothetical protein